MKDYEKRFRIYNETLKQYSCEVSYRFGKENNYTRKVFSRQQAKQYIEAINHVLVHELKKVPYKFRLELVKDE